MICPKTVRAFSGLFIAALQLLTSALFAEQLLVKANTLSLREKADSKATVIESLVTCDAVEVKARQGDWAQVLSKGGNTGWVLAKYLTHGPFVVVKGTELNVRAGPGEKYDVIMTFTKDYPLKVLGRSEGWIKVTDVEGDRGWVSVKQVAFDQFVITKSDKSNVRTGNGTENPIAFTTQKNVILKVLEEKEGWLKVKHSDGDEGWVSAKIVFGWLGEEPAKEKSEAAKPESKKAEKSGTSDKKDSGRKSTKAKPAGTAAKDTQKPK
ncbi:SH3 domain-containing protein [Candidatus Sumerlaeota bacterium]|nr:SH3 domain-containing protein [Candidatus Sumerlaeota bacterium]